MDKNKPTNQNLTIVQPTQQLTQFSDRKKDMRKLVKTQMKEGIDFGVIPGTDKKTLLQPGAEKLANLYNLIPKFELTKEVEDWDKGFFYYRYKCKLFYNVPLTRMSEDGRIEVYDAKTVLAGEAERSCNSREKKYLYSVVAERWATDEQRAKEEGRFTKKVKGYTNVYLRIRKTPDELADEANTIESMAQKRALVAAVRTATMASDIFLEEVSDAEPGATNQEEDFIRVNQIKRLHAVARPRGFDDEKLHLTIEKLYKVDSITKMTGAQIEELTQKLELAYEVVKPGEMPKRINGEGESIVKAAEEIFGATAEPAKTAEEQETPPEQGELVEENRTGAVDDETRKCAQCHKKPVNPSIAGEYGFCSKECQNLYYPPKPAKKLDQFLKNKKGGATP